MAPPPPQSLLMARFHNDPTSPLSDGLRVPGELSGEEAVVRWWRGGSMLVIGGCERGGRGIAAAAASSAWLHLRR